MQPAPWDVNTVVVEVWVPTSYTNATLLRRDVSWIEFGILMSDWVMDPEEALRKWWRHEPPASDFAYVAAEKKVEPLARTAATLDELGL